MLGSEHLLWALNTADPPPAATKYLHRFAPATTIAALLERFPPFSTRSTARTASDALDASPRVARIVAEAKRLASRTHTSQVTSDGLLLGILVDARNAAAAVRYAQRSCCSRWCVCVCACARACTAWLRHGLLPCAVVDCKGCCATNPSFAVVLLRARPGLLLLIVALLLRCCACVSMNLWHALWHGVVGYHGPQIIENASAGAVTATSILRALRLDAGEYLRRYEQIRSRAEPWTLYRVTGSGATSVLATSSAAGGDVGTPAVAATGGGATATVPKAPDINSGHLRRLMQGPTPATNWLLPGAVLMGAMPQSQRELVGVLDAGVTTIVPLVEEISMKHDYPAGIVRYLRDHPVRAVRLQLFRAVSWLCCSVLLFLSFLVVCHVFVLLLCTPLPPPGSFLLLWWFCLCFLGGVVCDTVVCLCVRACFCVCRVHHAEAWQRAHSSLPHRGL